jgi:chloramphenicol 3-O-phosphotransferase
MSGRIYLITGLMASGKSTVAQALAERLPKSVHLRGDRFRKMIVNGQAEMIGVELSKEAQAQLKLRYEIAADAAKRYADAGFAVVYQDIIIGPSLQEAVDRFKGYALSVTVLCPDAETIALREKARPKTGYQRLEDIPEFDKVLREETPKIGEWLDTSWLNVDETVDRILEAAG